MSNNLIGIDFSNSLSNIYCRYDVQVLIQQAFLAVPGITII